MEEGKATWGTWRYHIDDLLREYPPDFVEKVRSQAGYLTLRRNRLRTTVLYITKMKNEREQGEYFPLKNEDVEMFSDPLTVRTAEGYLDYMLEHLFSFLETQFTRDFFLSNGPGSLGRTWLRIKQGFVKLCIERGDGSNTLYEVGKALLKFSNRYANADGGMDTAGLIRRNAPGREIYTFLALYKNYESMKRNIRAKNEARINTKYEYSNKKGFVPGEPKKCIECKNLTYKVDSKLKLPFCHRTCQAVFYKTNKPSC